MDSLKNNFASIDFRNPMQESHERMQEEQRKHIESMTQKNAEKAKYNKDLLDSVKQIEENTSKLNDIVELIQYSNNQQEKMLSILSEIMSITKATNKEEAERLWTKIMGKITTTVDGVESISKLLGFGGIVYNQVIQNMDNINKGIEFISDKL